MTHLEAMPHIIMMGFVNWMCDAQIENTALALANLSQASRTCENNLHLQRYETLHILESIADYHWDLYEEQCLREEVESFKKSLELSEY